ncbi:MAG: FecR domain-containing protein [Oscillospiraceae bacterium]|nr:FecR domain-containing protein [Oscillospiraceae bacterium]
MKTAAKPKLTLIIALVAAAAVVIAGGVLIAMRMTRGYRTIQLYQLDGEAEVLRASRQMKPYVGMMLRSEDEAATFVESYLYLKLDDDKYVLAEPETRFSIVALGTSADSRTEIRLDVGAIVNHITVPLSEESVYEVTTPNSTMAVRGTSFRVFVWFDEDGVSHTLLQVFEGSVETRLIFPDGTMSAEIRVWHAGQTVMIWGNSVTSAYEVILDAIDYYSLEIPTLEFLKIGLSSLPQYDISLPEVDKIIELKQTYFTVSFVRNGHVFATQSVLWNHCAQVPTLKPAMFGRWNFDFETPITEDTRINWIGG